MPETKKYFYTVDFGSFYDDIIEYREFTLIKEDRPDYILWKVSEHDRLYEEDELYDTFEQAKAEAEKEIAKCIRDHEEAIADLKAIVLVDPRTRLWESK